MPATVSDSRARPAPTVEDFGTFWTMPYLISANLPQRTNSLIS